MTKTHRSAPLWTLQTAGLNSQQSAKIKTNKPKMILAKTAHELLSHFQSQN